MKKKIFAYAKTKTQISCAVTAQLISAFVFATQIVQYLLSLNPNFQASSVFLRLYKLVYVVPSRKPEDRFSQVAAHTVNRGSYTSGQFIWNLLNEPWRV